MLASLWSRVLVVAAVLAVDPRSNNWDFWVPRYVRRDTVKLAVGGRKPRLTCHSWNSLSS